MALLDNILDTKGIVGQIVTEIGKHIPIPPDQTKKLELETAIEQLVINRFADIDIAQSEVNKAELAKEGWWYSAWRPAIAWVCSLTLVIHWIALPWLEMFIPNITVPKLDLDALLAIMLGLLGLGTQRMFEKKWNVNKNR